MKGMYHGHGALFGTADEAIVVESSHEQGALSGTASEESIEEAKAPCEVSMSSSTIDKVSTERCEAIPLLGKVVDDEKGLQKTWWSAEPTKDLQHELAFLQGRLIDAEDTIASKWVAKVDETWYLVMLWIRMVKAEMKADHLEAKLAHALYSHRGIGTIKRKPPKSKHEPPATKKVQGSR